MESTPICRCRVLYLGSAVPQRSKDGLQGVQEPLKELYPERGAATGGIDSWLSVWSNGLLLENVDEAGARVARWFPIGSLHYCAAVRRVADGFLPLDSAFARSPTARRPPLFAAVLRRTRGIKVLECHAFVCRREAAANALVRCCFHAYADSSYARRLEGERAPPETEPDDATDGDENHKVWVGEPEREAAARAPRPRQVARPASVPPPPPPPPDESRKKSTAARKLKKKSIEEPHYAPAPGPGPWQVSQPMVLVSHPAATLPGGRARGGPGMPGGMRGGRPHYATVDPRRPRPQPPLRSAQSTTGLDDDGNGIYRKKGHMNERAFSYSIRQEHRSRSHGSLANLKFAAPPDVENGREELKKEREIMQLVAGLHLGPDEVERREVPPHMLRQRMAPR